MKPIHYWRSCLCLTASLAGIGAECFYRCTAGLEHSTQREHQCLLSWPTNFTGFTLEANTNLNTSNWSTVSPAPAVSGTNNVVTTAATEAQKFYRLVKP